MTGLLERIDARLARIEMRLAKCEPPLGAGEPMIDQKHSPLGPRNHCKAVRRRRNGGETGAEIIGKKHLLTRAALQEELDRCSMRSTNDVTPDEGDDAYSRARDLLARGKKGAKQ